MFISTTLKKTMIYQLYTDASKKNDYAIMAGVILGEKNRPICEFIVKENPEVSTDMLERNAMFIGMEIALQAGIKDIMIHSDNLNNINIFLGKNKTPKDEISDKEKLLIKSFKTIIFKHIPRNMNLYANALTNLPYNMNYLGNVRAGYHGVNRAKNRFYTRLKIGAENDKINNPHQRKTKTSAYTKLKTAKEILEHMSKQEVYTEKDMKRIHKMFAQMLKSLTEILQQKQSEITDMQGALYYFLENTKIKSSLYPDYIKKPLKEEKIKMSF